MKLVHGIGLRERLSYKELLAQLNGAFTYNQIRRAVMSGKLKRATVRRSSFPFHITDVNRWLNDFNHGKEAPVIPKAACRVAE